MRVELLDKSVVLFFDFFSGLLNQDCVSDSFCHFVFDRWASCHIGLKKRKFYPSNGCEEEKEENGFMYLVKIICFSIFII